MSASPMHEIQQLVGALGDGRPVAVWRTGNSDPDAPVVLLAPGFARRIRHMAPVALYLGANGFRVYRCDYLDHVGISDGDIHDFTMTSMYDSLRATLELIEQCESRAPVVVAASLANRAAIRLLARDGGPAGLIGIVGVVDTRKTLGKVFDLTWDQVLAEGYPEYVEFEHKRIRGESWWKDWHAGDWISLESTIAELREVAQPVVNFCGSADDWVALSDVQRAFELGDGGPRRLVELPYVEHELSTNPVAGQTVVREVIRLAVELAGAGGEGAPVEPDFEQITVQSVYERALESQIIAGKEARQAIPD
jgi:pimeloyl-ACP methyl ester carboxylesterase